MIAQIFFVIILGIAVYFFSKNAGQIIKNINLGQAISRNGNKPMRWKEMARVALGQSKMASRPVAGIMHLFVYIGFVLINIEVLEIVIDGIFGTHRVLGFLGGFYNFLIGFFEVLAFLVLVAVIVFWARRNIAGVKRFSGVEMKGWPTKDANAILYIEIILMLAILLMNGADNALQQINAPHYTQIGSFPISGVLFAWIKMFSMETLIVLERVCWWLHIIGIFLFLNYLPFSKHLHIILAFPNVWYSNLEAKGKFKNNTDVTREVKLMMDPNAAVSGNTDTPPRFGAKDVNELSWVQLMNAYSCTECGRCTSNCPANQTGKLLSPRKIMMDTRDRLEEVGKNKQTHGAEYNDNKTLVGDYITAEELWACTSCNACVEACPVNIDPLAIIMDLRQYLVLEKSEAPASLTNMFTNIENNGAPWQYSQADRLKWTNE